MNKIAFITTFATGVAAGSVATWFYLREKYEQLVQEEIQSVKDTFKNHYDNDGNDANKPCVMPEDNNDVEYEDDNDDAEDLTEEEDYDDYLDDDLKDEYETILSDEGYIDIHHQPYADMPYVISPDEFGDMDGYETAGMSYYADSRLADEKGSLVDIDETIGNKNLVYFGEYEEDMLHVRNPKTKTDYEIFLDPRKYSEVYPGRV